MMDPVCEPEQVRPIASNFPGTRQSHVSGLSMRPLQRPSKQIIDTIEYNPGLLDHFQSLVAIENGSKSLCRTGPSIFPGAHMFHAGNDRAVADILFVHLLQASSAIAVVFLPASLEVWRHVRHWITDTCSFPQTICEDAVSVGKCGIVWAGCFSENMP